MRIPQSRGPVARLAAQWLLTVAAAAVLAGCSNSIERFSANYDNPSDSDPVYTASVPAKKPVYKRPAYQAPAPSDDTIVETPIAKAPSTPSYSYEQSYQKAYKQPSYEQPSYGATKPRVKLNQLPPPGEQASGQEEIIDDSTQQDVPFQRADGYKAKSGTVRVSEGMTLFSIAKANGVSTDELARANNIRKPYTVVSGQILRIPAKGSEMAAVQTPKAKKKVTSDSEESFAEVPKPSGKGAVHTVSSGETLYSLGRKYQVSPFAIADANGLDRSQTLRLGQKVRIPGASQQMASVDSDDSAASSETIEAPVTQKPKKKITLSLAEEQATAGGVDSSNDQMADDTSAPAPKASAGSEEQVAQAPAASSGLNLRWPVKGKVISDFGPKANGLKNEGINIAVPEGTSVRAADGGVVAYAGSELKGYGNLILIRHSGGYVTAYAHAKELMVKRGDTVKRGDIIAKAGQTGAVSSPQLHFEVRKGATALDPAKYLASSTASN